MKRSGAEGHPSMKVSLSVDQAAREILQKSFCIFQSNPTVRNQISRSRSEALKILDRPLLFESLSRSCHQVIDGNLHGFHLPSNAKRLFRAFPSSKLQPWPNSTFKSSSQDLSASLHGILVDILNKLRELSESKSGDYGTETNPKPNQLTDNKTTLQSRRKRKRGWEESNTKSAKAVPTDNTYSVPTTVKETTKCPLDYFFYHNNDSRYINCSEHIDRGALICICLSSTTPGLEVLPRGANGFVCPEETLIDHNNLDDERNDDDAAAAAASELICVMAGDQLGTMLGKERMACVHRVRNDLPRPRLSISYELRL
ncbi:unnamed protein product [Cylindrotheca closterium]|uniref:Uncharacterized protein n=1 Tax=Cylindrotheca closterium TaxID=2856 RepID=A0AAD2FGZ5_9STRA|nr:unnamed protein product [Cylindrotheca closterium]